MARSRPIFGLLALLLCRRGPAADAAQQRGLTVEEARAILERELGLPPARTPRPAEERKG